MTREEAIAYAESAFGIMLGGWDNKQQRQDVAALFGAQIAIGLQELTNEETLLASKKGDKDATICLCWELSRLLRDDMPIPEQCHSFVADMLLTAMWHLISKRGRGVKTNWSRDLAILYALLALRDAGIPPTRNRARKNGGPACGCEIVTAILEKHHAVVAPDAVATVWNKWRHKLSAKNTPQ